MGTSALSVLSALLVLAGAGQAPEDDRLYGRVVTNNGQSFEGFLRWNEGEVSTTDYLDGGRVTPPEFMAEAITLDPEYAARKRAERSIVAFGQRITWDRDDVEGAPLSEAAIRFEYVRTLEPLDDRTARVTLIDGVVVDLRALSSEIGRRVEPISIETRDGTIERVPWRDLLRVDFLAVPPTAQRPSTRRLHGTLMTASGVSYTGNVRWDLDETIESDVLDGRGDGGEEDPEIPFSEIARIDWESARSARVTGRDGRVVELRGTNDVNREIRGIEISDDGLGRVIVHWEDFDYLRFHPPGEAGTDDGAADTQGGAGAGSGSLPGREPGAPIRGVVYAQDGRVIEGEVRWDNDESQWWEMLDGWSRDTEFGVEFARIATITRLSAESVAVLLLDGRTVALDGSNDVDDRNRGIFVKPDGRARRLVRWQDFERLELVR